MCAHRVMRTALDVIAFPQREQRENNPFPNEKQFSGLFFLDANIANALLIMSLIMKISFSEISRAKVKRIAEKSKGKREKVLEHLHLSRKTDYFRTKLYPNYYAIY